MLDDPALVGLYKSAKERYREGQYAEALELYDRLADLVPGDGRVAHLVGCLHRWGAGTRRDPAKAEQWWERAARAGHNYALLSLSILCRETGRFDEAQQWVEEATTRGYAPGIFYLGHSWEFGYLGGVDRTRAVEFDERAAARGYCRASWRLAAISLKGGRGIWRIPGGLVGYITAPLQMCIVLWRNPYDERVIW